MIPASGSKAATVIETGVPGNLPSTKLSMPGVEQLVGCMIAIRTNFSAPEGELLSAGFGLPIGPKRCGKRTEPRRRHLRNCSGRGQASPKLVSLGPVVGGFPRLTRGHRATNSRERYSNPKRQTSWRCGQSSANPSPSSKFPVSRENTGNFCRLSRVIAIQLSHLRTNSRPSHQIP
jgi:hypothetical protein